MLSKLEIQNSRGILLTLPLYDDESGYKISNIEGLNPVEASMVSSNYAGLDGEQFHSARRSVRDVKIDLDLEPDYIEETITSLRNSLYSFLMPKSEVLLRFHMNTGLRLEINARVENFETPLFSKDPDVQISLRCFQPDFIDPRIIKILGSTVSDDTDIIIPYPGTVETGVIVTLLPQRDLTAFTIYCLGENNIQQQLDFPAPLLAGDKLVISSLRGAKGVTLTRENVTQSYLYGRSSQSSWIELAEGDNKFRIYANGDPIPYELEYVVRYGGL